MLSLPLLLLAALFLGADSKDQGVTQDPISFHLIQISIFTNSSWAQNQGSGWLDELQIHGWDTKSETAIFLKPWSKGNFSEAEVTELEELFRVYLLGFIREVQDHAHKFHLEYPFEIQGIAGCELHYGGAIHSFLRGGIGGLDFLSFQNGSCQPALEGGTSAQQVCEVIEKYHGICDTTQKLLLETCPRFLLGILMAGKAELQRQGQSCSSSPATAVPPLASRRCLRVADSKPMKPEAWLSPGPPPGPGRLLLVCHISGFHPKPVWAMWMLGEQEQMGTQREDLLPQADGTWYLRVTLDVAAWEASGLACRVRHSSLGGQDLLLHWGHSSSVSWVIWTVLLPSLLCLMGVAFWVFRRWAYQKIP